jgi:hypothetical protein
MAKAMAVGGRPVLTLEVRRAGESRKSAGFSPPGMLKKDDGDTGGGDSGSDGGVMALYLDAPPATPADPPSTSVKLVLANENDPGLEFAGASMLPDDEVVIGAELQRREESHSSGVGIDQTGGGALGRPVCGGVVRGVVRRVRPGWPARWSLGDEDDEVGEKRRRWKERTRVES